MKTTVALLFLLCIHYMSSAQQTQSILLLNLTFDNEPNPMLFDSAGPGGNYGTNDWIVNDSFTGRPVYPNTPNEDSTVNGLVINNAPFSNYLHIHDVTAANGIENDNWNTGNASDRFCYMASPFCTLGLDSVQITFDWLCQGDSNAYGQVYYSTGNGQWVQIGRPKYYNQKDWLYESITDTGLNNQANIQLGFRWVNTGADSTTDEAFGIDDLFAVGTYNPADTNTAVSISTNVYADSGGVCQGGDIYILFDLSSPLCDGNYELELSDADGTFDSPYNLGILQGYPTVPLGYYGPIALPPALIGDCFKVRIVRTGPAPALISDTSACFPIISCVTQNEIFNITCPVISNDPDTTCIQSEIDVQFNSLGTFRPGNIYYAELSDANGNFSDSTILGTLVSSDSFPVNFYSDADIAGIIPASLPPGCGYRLRVRSSYPLALDTMPGTYCLKHCDELTNNTQNIQLCTGAGSFLQCDSIDIAINHWNQDPVYGSCNNWTVELRNTQDFSLAGNLTVYHSTTGGIYALCMPTTADSLPVQPGEYYMRIVSSCSSQPWNSTGTVIRATIGAPAPTPPVISFPGGDSMACAVNGSLVAVAVTPFYSPPSEYQWSSDLLNNGIPFYWPYQELLINLNSNVRQGTYLFYVQEVSYGCYGPQSAGAALTINGKPDATIQGNSIVCAGDTAPYNVNFLSETYYNWAVSPSVQILNSSNVEARCIFDSLGTYEVSVYILNECDSSTGSFKVNVVPPYYTVNAGPDTSVCKNSPVTLAADAGQLNKTFVVQDTGSMAKQGGMFNLVAQGDVTIDSFAVRLQTRPQILQAEIWGKPGSYLGFESDPSAWVKLAVNYSNSTALTGRFTIISAAVSQFIAAGDTFAFYITSVNSPVVNIIYGGGNGLQGTPDTSDGDFNFIQGTALSYPFTNALADSGYIPNVAIFYTTRNGLQYSWSSGVSTSSIPVAEADTGTYLYSVVVTDPGKCRVTDTAILQVLDCNASVSNLGNEDDLFAAFPNPTTGKLYLEASGEVLMVKIYDMKGAMVWQGPARGNMLDISGISDGEYLLTAITAENIWKKKVILFR